MPLRTQMLPSLPSGSSAPRSSRMRMSTPGKGCPMPVPPGSSGLARTQPGARDEAELGGAVVLENGGVGRPAPGRLQRPGIQLGAGADDAADAGGVDARRSGPRSLSSRSMVGTRTRRVMPSWLTAACDVADVEVVQGVELRAGVQAFGEGVEVQAGRERSGGQGPVVLASGRRTRWRPRTTPARTAASG